MASASCSPIARRRAPSSSPYRATERLPTLSVPTTLPLIAIGTDAVERIPSFRRNPCSMKGGDSLMSVVRTVCP